MQQVKAILSQIPALAGRVQGAAKLADLTKRGAGITADVAAFVLGLGLRGSPPDAVTGIYRQPIERLVGVVLMVRNLGDATGDKAAIEMDALVDEVVQAIAGVEAEGAIGVFALVRGELVDIVAGTITYQLDFAVEDQLRIAR